MGLLGNIFGKAKNKDLKKNLKNLKDNKKSKNIKELTKAKKIVSRKKDIKNKKTEEIKKIVKEIKQPTKKEEAKIKPEKKEEKQKKEKVSKIKISLKKKKKKEGEEFIKTDIPGFDALIKDGIPKGSAVLVEGGPGSGKTIFCLTLLKNLCEKGKKVLYMSFEEKEDRLKHHMTEFGANPKEYEKKGLLYVKRFNALDIARSVEALLSEAKKELLIDVQPVLIPKDFEPDIIIMDSLTSIGSAFSGESSRFRIYMEQLFRYLESHNITSFLIREVPTPTHTGNVVGERGGEAVSFLSDGIIALYSVFYDSGIRKRALEFLKMRGVNIDRRIVEIDIKGKQGLVVYPNRVLKGKYTLT